MVKCLENAKLNKQVFLEQNFLSLKKKKKDRERFSMLLFPQQKSFLPLKSI